MMTGFSKSPSASTYNHISLRVLCAVKNDLSNYVRRVNRRWIEWFRFQQVLCMFDVGCINGTWLDECHRDWDAFFLEFHPQCICVPFHRVFRSAVGSL